LQEGDPFRQLEEVLPTPNDQRTASGAPGKGYWQQRVDHDISVTLDPAKTELVGTARVTYHNNSPDELRYLWFQLEQNRFRDDSLGARAQPAPDLSKPTPIGSLRQWIEQHEWEGGYRDVAVTDADGKPLRVTIVDTMMRVDLPAPLPPGGRFTCDMSWRFLVVKNTTARARSNYELLGENDLERTDADLAPLYVMAQFFPRAAPYNDVRGWQHKPFLGQGEFALEFGNYTLAVTVPDTWTVAATGELENAAEVLSAEQRASRSGPGRREAALHHESGGGRRTPCSEAERHQDLALQGRRCPRRRLRGERELHLGRGEGADSRDRPRGARDELLPRRGGAPLESLFDARGGAHHRLRLTVRHSVSLPGRDQRERSGGRHGVPNDHLQRPEAGARRNVYAGREVGACQRDHPRGDPLLVPDDHQLRRAPVDLDGRGTHDVLPVPRRAGVGGEVSVGPR
jgi:hypothetical protein